MDLPASFVVYMLGKSLNLLHTKMLKFYGKGERRKTGYLRVSPLQLGKLYCFHLYSASTAAGRCPCCLSPLLSLSSPHSPLLSLVAGKVNEMERNEMNTLAHKYTLTETQTQTYTI